MFLILHLLYIVFSSILSGAYYLSQVLTSVLIGLFIYFLFFKLFEFDLSNGHIFHFLTIDKFWLFLVVYGILFIFSCLVYLVQDDKGNGGDDGGYRLNKSHETFIVSLFSLSSILSLLGIKLEYHFVCRKNKYLLLSYNFDTQTESINEIKNVSETFASSITVTKNTRWNDTTPVLSFFRLLILYALVALCLLPYVLMSYNNNINAIYCIKFILPICLVNF